MIEPTAGPGHATRVGPSTERSPDPPVERATKALGEPDADDGWRAQIGVRFRPLWTEPHDAVVGLVEELWGPIVDASRPFADWYFGEPDVAAEIIREWMTRPTSELFVGRSILLEDPAGQVLGCILALTGAELARCRAADFAAFCGELGSDAQADEVVEEILAASHELFPPVGDDELYISRVAVHPSQRHRGLGRALVREAIEVFRPQGLRRCRLDVSADNAAAIRAYEAAGLRTLVTSHSPTAGLRYCAMVSDPWT